MKLTSLGILIFLTLIGFGGCRMLWGSKVLIIHGLENLPAMHAKEKSK